MRVKQKTVIYDCRCDERPKGKTERSTGPGVPGKIYRISIHCVSISKSSLFAPNKIESRGEGRCHAKNQLGKFIFSRIKKKAKAEDKTCHTTTRKICCCLFATGIKKGESEGYKCHAETIMSTKS